MTKTTPTSPSTLNDKVEALVTKLHQSIQRKVVLKFFGHELPKYLRQLDDIYADWKTAQPKDGSRARLIGAFIGASDKILKRAGELDRVIENKRVLKQSKIVFRQGIRKHIYIGRMMRRGYQKPFGYPGDFKLIEAAYRNQPWTKGVGELSDLLFLQDSYITAVRHRKDEMRRLLELRLKKPSADKLRILNLGAGSCRELREIDESVFASPAEPVELFLLDKEPRSLAFSQKELLRKPNIKVNLVETDIVDYARNPKRYLDKLGRFDLIYCIGLADYIPDYYLAEMMKTSIMLTKYGGEFVVAHKDLYRHQSLASDWMCDWTFIPRSPNQFMRLVNGAVGDKRYLTKLRSVTSGHVFFVTVRKKDAENSKRVTRIHE